MVDWFLQTGIKRDVKLLEAERDELKANVNMGAIAQFRLKEREWLARVAEVRCHTTSPRAIRAHATCDRRTHAGATHILRRALATA